MKKIGLLLINVGTPSAPTPKAVRQYLKAFLSDPWVVDKPRWLWLPLLYGLILPLRSHRSADKYQAIWTAEGSPLLIYSQKIKDKLQAMFPDIPIGLGMRYGDPSLKSALQEFQAQDLESLIILPLYPQYSLSTSKSAIEYIQTQVQNSKIKLQIIQDYHQHPAYIDALATSIKKFWEKEGRPQKLILSYHGLPRAMIQKGDPYEAQCKKTTELLAQTLNLHSHEYLTTFQSRVGPEAWLSPYTLETIRTLPAQNIKNIHVVCPGFACDCLETLEEINILNRQAFLKAGGERFHYIPCLNNNENQINMLKKILEPCI